MKTPNILLKELGDAHLTVDGSGHSPACCCDRCKHGVETFLLESDIAEIQRDAREGMVPVEDLRKLIQAADNSMRFDVFDELKTLRAKHPNLFTDSTLPPLPQASNRNTEAD